MRGSQQSLAPTPTPFDKFSADGGHMSPQRLWKPFVFTLAVRKVFSGRRFLKLKIVIRDAFRYQRGASCL